MTDTPTERLHALSIEVPEVKKADADYRAWYLGDASSTDAMVSQSYAIDALVDVAETLKAERDRLGGVARVYELANETLGKAKYELEEENSRLKAERDRLKADLVKVADDFATYVRETEAEVERLRKLFGIWLALPKEQP